MSGRSSGYLAVGAIGLVLLLNHVDRLVLAMLVEPIRRALHLNDGQIGLLTGPAFAIAYALSVIPIARWAERGRRVTIITICALIWSAAMAACGLAAGFGGLLLARMIVASGEAGGLAPSMSIVSDLFPIHRRASAMAVFGMGAALGAALAPLIGGALINAVGWRGTFLALGLAGAPIVILFTIAVREPKRGGADGLSASPATMTTLPAIASLFRRPSFALLVGAFVLVTLAQFAMLIWLPAFFERSYAVTRIELGAKLSLCQGLPLIVGTLAGGVLADWLARHDQRWLAWMQVFSALVSACFAGLVFTVHDESAAFALLVAPALAQGLSVAAGYTLLQNLSAVHSRATATAVLGFCVSVVGAGLGPLLLGLVSQSLSLRFGAESLRYALLLACPIFAAAALLFWTLAYFLAKDLENARQDSLGAARSAA